MIIVLMGVAGSGKTTVGRLLAEQLGWAFADADDFHSPENRAKMAAGVPLNDLDRAPWLASLREHLDTRRSRDQPAVLACSALKERYRKLLQGDSTDIRWVHLRGRPELIRSRMMARQGHYMRPELLDSQLAALEPPADALSLDVVHTPAELVAQIRRALAV